MVLNAGESIAAYRAHGVEWGPAATMGILGSLPITSSVVSGVEMFDGRSLRPGEGFGEQLRGWDYADRAVGMIVDGVIGARTIQSMRGPRGPGRPRVIPEAERAALEAMNPNGTGRNNLRIGGETTGTPPSGFARHGFNPPPGTRIVPPGIPRGWRIRPTRGDGGVRYFDPRNPGNAVRVMPGDPASPWINSRSPYVRWQRNGQALDVNGNQVPKHTPDAHIPLPLFNFIASLFI